MENELELLEMCMNVYEECGGGVGTEYEEQMEGLVTPYRKFVRTEVIGIKKAPFSSANEEVARAYFFMDIVIIAVAKGSGTPDSIGSMLETEDAGKHNTLKRYKNKYEVIRWLDLHRCTIRNAHDEHALQVTFVTREREIKKSGTIRVLTRVEKLELWFESPELAQEIYADIVIWIDDLIEVDLRRASMSSTSDIGSVISGISGRDSMASGKTGETSEDGKKRSWASRKQTMRRNGTFKTHGTGALSRKGSAMSETMDGSDSIGGLSLSDLESRYKIKLDTPSTPDGSVEYVVEFGEGMMGFRLSSGPSVGVIVGKVAEGSFCDDAGVCIGDRVVEIDETPVEIDTPWQDAVELIKQHPRPIRIKFERFAGRAVIDHGSHGSQEKRRSLLSVTKTGASHHKSEKRRAWAAKRAQRVHAADEASQDERLISLKEVEKLYRAGKTSEVQENHSKISDLFEKMKTVDADEPYQQSIRVLEEIWSTERTYVQDLRLLVREFIMPLRRKTKRLKCREQQGSRICEHNMLRSQCSRTSATAEALISSEDMRVIFLNVETLVKINSELLTYMERELLKLADDDSHVATVTDVTAVYSPAFQRIMPFVKLYSLYCHMYPSAIDHLLMLRNENQDVDEALKEREKRANTSLNSLLITPVQRLCRYPLLFNELLRHVRLLGDRPGLQDHVEELERTAKIVAEVADKVNTIVGEQEDHETLMDVYNELGGAGVVDWLIAPSRKFITKVNVLMHEAPFNGDPKVHIMYLCSDMIIFGKPAHTLKFGSLKKTGGKNGTSRAMSLRRTFGSIHRTGHGHGSLSKGTSSLHRSNGRTGQALVKLVKTLELKSVTPHLLTDMFDDCSGIELKYVERIIDSGGKGRSAKQKTNINKIRIWLPTADEQQSTFEDIEHAVQKLKTVKEEQQLAHSRHGKMRTARSWKTRSKFSTMGSINSSAS